MNDLRIAVIGLGVRAYLIGLAHRPGQGSRVVALCDVDARVLSEQVQALGGAKQVFFAEDHRRVLDRSDVDAVLVLTPDHTHEAIVIDALRAGKAVFCDKPLAISTSGCDRILSTAQQTGSRLYVGHNMRHFAMVKLLKQLIEQGAIGEPRAIWCRHFVGHGGDYYFKDWHAQRRHTNSLLLQKGA
ncbi:MAG TPA: Gfo/Idh/MocA family oxidoreductase, partial [Polyangiales bacterium]|nr:Gfo/Idh/MocA family oxidoreductase [Polyangiales bacterium]